MKIVEMSAEVREAFDIDAIASQLWHAAVSDLGDLVDITGDCNNRSFQNKVLVELCSHGPSNSLRLALQADALSRGECSLVKYYMERRILFLSNSVHNYFCNGEKDNHDEAIAKLKILQKFHAENLGDWD